MLSAAAVTAHDRRAPANAPRLAYAEPHRWTPAVVASRRGVASAGFLATGGVGRRRDWIGRRRRGSSRAWVRVSPPRSPAGAAISAGVTSVSNVGPGLGEIGAFDHFAHFPSPIKIGLAFCMIAGRLELFTLLVLLSPAFWRR